MDKVTQLYMLLAWVVGFSMGCATVFAAYLTAHKGNK